MLTITIGMMKKKIYFIMLLTLGGLLFISCKEDIDPGIANSLAGLFSLFIEFASVIITALFGGVFAVLGFWLVYKGYTGEISLLMSGDGLEAKLLNASPGIILIALGFLLIWRSRSDIPKIRRYFFECLI